MKLFLLMIIFSVSSFAQGMSQYYSYAENSLPLIEKGYSAGFAPEEWQRSEVCRVYFDKVVISRTVGKVNLTEYKNLKIDKSVIEVAKAAMKEKNIADPNLPLPCDYPATWISVLGNDSEGVLFDNGNCSSPKIEKSGTNTQIIKEIVNRFCPDK